MMLYNRQTMALHQKVLLMLTLAVGSLLSLTGCSLTRKNAAKMRAADDPKLEFQDRLGTRCEGELRRHGAHLMLTLPDFFSRGRSLQMVFPAQRIRPGRQPARAEILASAAAGNSQPGTQKVEVLVLDGLLDETSEMVQKETQGASASGLPSRLVLGLHVERRQPGLEVATYSLAYRPAAGGRYITAAAAGELLWMKRSRPAQAGRALLYPLTLPMDAAAVPVEAGAVLLMHPGNRKP